MRCFQLLVVEDFKPFRQYVCSTLQQRARFRVTEASDGLEAVQKAEKLRPDLILLDIGLPNLNGMEVANRVRKIAPDAKILFLSQESSPEVVRQALNIGAYGYVQKSFAGSELLPAVEVVLRGQRFVGRGLEFSERNHAADISYQRLDEIIAKLKCLAKLADLLDGILDAGIEMSGADFGNIQVRNQENELMLMAHRGFGSEFVRFFKTVRCGDNCVCGTAFKNGRRVIVEDVATDPIFGESEARTIILNAHARACQSTPIFGRTGDLFGMLNTHYRRPGRPSDGVLQILELLAYHAGDLIRRLEASQDRPANS